MIVEMSTSETMALAIDHMIVIIMQIRAKNLLGTGKQQNGKEASRSEATGVNRE